MGASTSDQSSLTLARRVWESNMEGPPRGIRHKNCHLCKIKIFSENLTETDHLENLCVDV